ncbi:MAG: hypothetical protein AAGC60_17755 [Acidobacteriota bacterium]
MKRHLLPLLVLLVALGFAAPSDAVPSYCSSTCTSSSPCDLVCYDSNREPPETTCGAYGTCASSCQDPKSVTTREETVHTGSTVTSINCHFDHWYGFDPDAPPRLYEYTTHYYRIDTIRVTTYCDGSVTEEVIDSRNTSGFCAQRTWTICYFAYNPPPITCL